MNVNLLQNVLLKRIFSEFDLIFNKKHGRSGFSFRGKFYLSFECGKYPVYSFDGDFYFEKRSFRCLNDFIFGNELLENYLTSL